ncbi:MAG: hypothetical protein IPJ89_05425 [Candidatus Iainarchaeum archaeon]|uniref:Uncharacterized protein n=1 Tax=Candidatus Iainarchaeum sp. TaxID=3101447 RepID=A0A7T9I2A9_9ARCH|nr:MAG: hypothetical protein IPJ89_05425 [Candidatus Diapherotrites archaeon]
MKNPRKRARNYLGVDEKIRSPTRYERLLRASNLELRIRPAEETLADIIAAGKKTRHINIDMPNPIKMKSTIETVIRAAPQILFPNSKIFIASEDESVIAHAVAAAKRYGLRTQKMAELQRIQTPRGLIYPRRATAFMREYMRITGNPIYRIAIIFTPKTARRNQK